MSNPDFNAQSPAYKKKGAGGYTYRKGAPGAEHGKQHKDTVTKWPKPGTGNGVGFNRTTRFPVVKTRVVSDKID